MEKYDFDWSDLAFGSKKPLKELGAIFIAAPREISSKRFAQLLKEYLPKSPIVLGVAKEEFIDGFNGQLQFATLKLKNIKKIIDKVNSSNSPNKVYVLHYFQREIDYIIQKIPFMEAVFINGSWKQTFHTTAVFYTLVNSNMKYNLISPFADEAEAISYEKSHPYTLHTPNRKIQLSSQQMLEVADEAAKASYDYSFQTGTALGRRISEDNYEFIASSFNRVIPYQTYAMHHGNSREKHFSAPQDINHHDAIHAEMDLLVKAQAEHIDLNKTSLFINLLPCPSCARTLSQTDISEIIYRYDYSEGYAVRLLEQCGKVVRRLV